MMLTQASFITIDGPHGVGKTSILSAVASQLISHGYDVLQTKEPTMSPLGMFTREGEAIYRGRVLAHLVMADRYFHLEHEVNPALSKGKIVLCDRYIASSLVLQRMDGLDLDVIWSLNKDVRVPELSFILLAHPDVLTQRLTKRDRLSRFEEQSLRKQEVFLYREAASFLSKKGFHVVISETDTNSMEQVVHHIVQEIFLYRSCRTT